VPVFTSGLEDGDPALRFLCAWILASIAPDDPEVRRHLLLHSDDRDERVRFVVFRSALRDPMDEEQTRVIVRAMESRELDFQILQEVGSRGVNSVPVQDALRRLLAATTEPHLLGDVAVASVRSGGDPAEAGSRLLGSLKGASDLNATETLWALSLIGYRAPEVLDQISVFVGSHDVGTRAAASSACAALGGSQEMITQMTLAWGYSHLGYLPRWDDLSVPVLSAALEDKSNRSRETACRFLAEVGERASCTLPRLRELRRDTDQGVKDSADHAVKMIEWEMKHREAAVKLREERRASIPRDHPW
jgi:hypothetical protein